jgi:hypothetical protein
VRTTENKKQIEAARERVLGSLIGITLQRQNTERKKRKN